MKRRLVIQAVVIATSAFLLGRATGAETAIPLKQLPPAVRKAADANLQGGVIKAASKETENGQTYYEVETTRGGRGRDLLFDVHGQLVSVEEEIAPDAVPAAVGTALAAHGTVLKVELVTKGSAVSYEGVVERAGKRSEVVVDAEGKAIKP